MVYPLWTKVGGWTQSSTDTETYCWWKKSQTTTWDVWNPKNNGINYLSTGAGFLPSTVTFIHILPIAHSFFSTDFFREVLYGALRKCRKNHWSWSFQKIPWPSFSFDWTGLATFTGSRWFQVTVMHGKKHMPNIKTEHRFSELILLLT